MWELPKWDMKIWSDHKPFTHFSRAPDLRRNFHDSILTMFLAQIPPHIAEHIRIDFPIQNKYHVIIQWEKKACRRWKSEIKEIKNFCNFCAWSTEACLKGEKHLKPQKDDEKDVRRQMRGDKCFLFSIKHLLQVIKTKIKVVLNDAITSENTISSSSGDQIIFFLGIWTLPELTCSETCSFSDEWLIVVFLRWTRMLWIVLAGQGWTIPLIMVQCYSFFHRSNDTDMTLLRLCLRIAL